LYAAMFLPVSSIGLLANLWAAVQMHAHLRIQAHFRWDARFPKGDIASKRITDAVTLVIFRLQQECRWRPACNGNNGVSSRSLSADGAWSANFSVPEIAAIVRVQDRSGQPSLDDSFLCRPNQPAVQMLVKCVLTAATRCPSEENPSTPT
jgi:hypothetical protein